MSKKYNRTLASLFSNQMSSNLHWKEIDALLTHLGAELIETRGSTVIAKLNGYEFTLHRPHHGATMGKNELHRLRDFLAAAGVHS